MSEKRISSAVSSQRDSIKIQDQSTQDNTKLEKRLDNFEKILERIQIQQDQLNSQRNFQELIPFLQKCDQSYKNQTKLYQNFDEKTVQIENQMNLIQKQYENMKNLIIVKKKSENDELYLALKNKVIDIEFELKNHSKISEATSKEHIQALQREFNSKLDQLRQEMSNKKQQNGPDLKKSIQQINSIQKNLDQNQKQGQIQNIKEQIEQLIQNQFADENSVFLKSMNNMFQELGQVKCQIEHVFDEQRKIKINNAIKDNLLNNSDNQNQKYFIHQLENEQFMKDIESLTNDTVQRLNYEVESIKQQSEKLLSNSKNNESKSKVVDYLKQKIDSIQYQLQGLEIKAQWELSKIQNSLDQLTSHNKSDIIKINQFSTQRSEITRLKEFVQQNVNQTQNEIRLLKQNIKT